MISTMDTKTAQKDVYATRIFHENLNATTPLVINRGGARSSKSYSILQLLVCYFLTLPKVSILIVRKTSPSLRVSTMITLKQIMRSFGVNNIVRQVRFDYHYRDNFIHCTSVDDPDKIKSTEWNFIFIEEANQFTYDDYRILDLRLSAPAAGFTMNRLFMAFNPVDGRVWVKTKLMDRLIPGTDYVEIHSTEQDNPFLDDAYRKKIRELEAQDKNYYRIYALGEWGTLENLVYNRYTICAKIPDEGDTFYGLDFGWHAMHPTALIKCVYNNGEVYAKQMVYESGLHNKDLIDRMRAMGVGKKPIYADPSEPAFIDSIYRAGFNIHRANNDVQAGIDCVQSFNLNIHYQSQDLIDELRSYSWRKDKDGTLVNGEVVKFKDDGADATRYAIFTHLGQRLFDWGKLSIKSGGVRVSSGVKI